MDILNYLKTLFGNVTAAQAAATELAEAELSVLRSESSVEYSNALTVYNRQRVKRLRAFMDKQPKKLVTS